MLKKQNKEHILNQQFLTPLQKKILLFLAVHDPQNIKELDDAIEGNYRSTWAVFQELKKKNLIKEITVKHYRGRDIPRFWLSDMGIAFALSARIKPKVLLKKTREIYPENKQLQFLIEAIPILGNNGLNMLYLSVVTNCKFEESDLISIFASQSKLSNKKLKKYNSIAKRYPERYKQTQDYIKETKKNLKDLSELLAII